jgi:hypothetical protein
MVAPESTPWRRGVEGQEQTRLSIPGDMAEAAHQTMEDELVSTNTTWANLARLGVSIIAFATLSAGIAQAQQSGTALSTTKTAAGFWERLIEYDWTVLKEVSPSSITLGVGESAMVTYKITTTRTAKAPADTYGATGQICVTNDGTVATQNLLIADNVQAKVGNGQFTTIAFNAVDTSAKPVLGPGESYCYPYKVTFSPVVGATYRNEAQVTITNHSGWLPGGNKCPGPQPCPFGSQYRVGFTLPTTYTIVYKDTSATITDTFTDLNHFSVTPSESGPWTQTAAGTIQFTATVSNADATCNTPYSLLNTATLVENHTQDTRSDPESLGITTKDCSQPLFSGCTYTQGYWKTHPEAWPLSDGEMVLGNWSYPVEALQRIFEEQVKGNGLISLAHQLIAAKLNVANGANGGSLFNAIAQADAQIGDRIVPPTTGGGYLAPDATSPLVQNLTLFNQGGLTEPFDGDYDEDGDQDGPPHCGQ